MKPTAPSFVPKDFAGNCRVFPDDEGHTAFTLRLANGLRIHSMSSNADAQAGKRGDRVLDEFALHPDPRKLYSIAYPGITWGGQLEIFSTHRGTANYFNQLILEARHKGNPKKFSLHRVTLQDALEEGFLYKLQCKLPDDDERSGMDEAQYFDYIRAGAPDEETFQEEFMCVPSDDASAFLSFDLLDACKYRPGEKWEMSLKELRECKDPLYLGGDIARTKDLTVFWIVKAVAGFRPTVHRVALQKTAFEEQERRLYELLELPSLQRACIDNSGIGRQLVERAQKRFGAYKVEAITFTAAVKEELVYPLRAAFEDRTARIPDDRKIIASHRAVRKETTAAGNIRFVAESNEAGHADDFWAHALALHASKIPETGAITDPSKIRYGPNFSSGALLAPRRVLVPRTVQRTAARAQPTLSRKL
ncbi:MAG TPA: terminase family protein [Chthoniobacterales bacterium]|jgi:phage FluMu gp28-like protein|nr:terminase family protein [Chthoniobacterales bacterium]